MLVGIEYFGICEIWVKRVKLIGVIKKMIFQFGLCKAFI